MRLLVLIPCRNEAAVIERKLHNLAQVRWPAVAGQQRIVVVDDGSSDGTAQRARAAAAQLPAHLALEVIENQVRPGKPGAMQAGLARCEPDTDLVVLSDADVLLEPAALMELVQAFEREPHLGMACGAQRFVDPQTGAPAGAAWDHWTARVRHWESQWGALYSVHGQLLAWRAHLRLMPPLGIAADDIALALAVRSKGWQVRLVPQAIFIEHKTTPGPQAQEQALRRARAYLQVVRRVRPPMRSIAARVQCALYRNVPPAAPLLTVVALLALALGPIPWLEGYWRAVPLLLVGISLLTPPVRRWWQLMRLIARAQALERQASIAERWEMLRT